MLKTLQIQNFVVIKDLTVDFHSGLTILTGETGAGKSILLDALLFVLGARGQKGLIAKDQDKATVHILLDMPGTLNDIFHSYDIPCEDFITIRRSINVDGGSKAFLNDVPVTASLLKEIAPYLIDIHGQFERFLTPSQVRDLLDGYGKIFPETILKEPHACWRQAEQILLSLQQKSGRQDAEIAYLTFAIDEISVLNPIENELSILQEQRQKLRAQEKVRRLLIEIQTIFEGTPTIEEQLFDGMKKIEALTTHTEKAKIPLTLLEKSYDILQEALTSLQGVTQEILGDDDIDINEVESRIFALNNLARKYDTPPEDLHNLHEKLLLEKTTLENIQENLIAAEEKCLATRNTYINLAKEITQKRVCAADSLAQDIEKILPQLKLPDARVLLHQTMLPEQQWSEYGQDHIVFHVSFNTGGHMAPLNNVASGGELSRFMLALKVTTQQIAKTLIFDEVDSGMGGAVADAVGAHLKSLSKNVQVLTVTHAPQVAAYADHHSVVQKTTANNSVRTTLTPLHDTNDRITEIARMLSGAEISEQALEAAKKLMDHKAA